MPDFEYIEAGDFILLCPCSPQAQAIWPDFRQHPAFAAFNSPFGDTGAEFHVLFWRAIRAGLRRAGYSVRKRRPGSPRFTASDEALLAALGLD